MVTSDLTARTAASPAFATVFEQHGPALLRFCVREAGRERGEDVFQETMLAALRAYGTVRDPAAVRSWLYAIATRKAIDAHRSAAREPAPVADPGDHGGVASDGPPQGADEVWLEVAQLPEKQRIAVTLRYLGDLSHAEIATAMATSEEAARRNVFEGLRRLRLGRERG